MFPACSTGGGTALGAPDTCNTPSPTGVTPIPYPNTATLNMAVGFSTTVLISNMPALHLQSQVPTTSGDEGGVAGGVASGLFKGPCKFTKGSTKVQIGGQPAVRLLDTTGHNGASPNATGAVIAPSQVMVLVGG